MEIHHSLHTAIGQKIVYMTKMSSIVESIVHREWENKMEGKDQEIDKLLEREIQDCKKTINDKVSQFISERKQTNQGVADLSDELNGVKETILRMEKETEAGIGNFEKRVQQLHTYNVNITKVMQNQKDKVGE